MIQLEEVTKTYARSGLPTHALDGVSLSIATGEFALVRGPSGCGKSTLLALVGGLATPSSGRVVVAGQDIGAMSYAARARFRAANVGFVFQTFHLVPYLSVVENVVAAMLPGRQSASARTAQAKELLERFHLAHRLHHRPSELSTGESQRVAIARALINGPRLVLADEPTGNLDPANAAAVLSILQGFHRDGGTVLMVTHQELAAQYAQRTIRLEAGRLVEPEAAGTKAADLAALAKQGVS